ncbi:hypothetical protein AVENP_2624 [Arcobacter venerupis]|uniref:Uncharacterized protein n=1 Tax=Arcobacter venerupis TaxID=1054033 RepID=A0AAE7BD73_9BACT|nr:hypothetical protein [Arcobacter venerupis]QKF68120.1 hypothetical protein AVENP_2624 [Arcobacter venerupis]RWS48873.1 hypothetical protein CKA56_12105 [Arcobacter venerupis]
MPKETLKLTPWEQLKEKVRRWFGKGEYGTSRDFLTLHQMRENSIDLELLLFTKEFKQDGLTKDVYGTNYELKKEFSEFEEKKAKGEYLNNEQTALDFLKNYNSKLSQLDSKVDELAQLKKEIATIKSVINGNDLDVKKEEELQSFRTHKEIEQEKQRDREKRWREKGL